MNGRTVRCGAAVWALLVSLLLLALPAAGQNGIFADFTTSLGNFTCQLDYTNAPRTVANFVGLATGQRPWLDLTTGRARTNAFYHGLTFHRVIAGFMNQGGSPNGIGTDDPGYVITDEFSPKLTFDSFGVMAMANSGPDSGGSQFFITVGPWANGNNRYTIFGKLVSGSNVVYAINNVATDANDKPLTNVVMQQVAIRRVGTAAQAFDISAQGLPLVTNVWLKLTNLPTQVSLTFSNRLYADNRLYYTTNLTSWTGEQFGIETAAPTWSRLYGSKSAPGTFFRMAQVQYASSTFAPKTLYGRTLVLNFTAGIAGSITITFDAFGGGTFSYSGGGSGTVTGYDWTQEPFRGKIEPIMFSNLVPPLDLVLIFNSTTAGYLYNSVAYPYYPYVFGAVSLAGTFTLSGP